MLLSHGYSATSAMWTGQVGPLSASHKLIIWDMRGHGNSDSPANPAEYSEALTTDDMAALLDAADAQTAVIGGLSLGGYMSLSFNVAFPHRVRALDAVRYRSGLSQRRRTRRLEPHRVFACEGTRNERAWRPCRQAVKSQ